MARRIGPQGVPAVDLQVSVQPSLDAAVSLAARAEGLHRPQWMRRVLARAAEAPHPGPAPRSKVRLRDAAGRLVDDARLMRALARLDPGRAVPNSGRSQILRLRVAPRLAQGIEGAVRVAHQPPGDWIRDQLTKSATWRLERLPGPGPVEPAS